MPRWTWTLGLTATATAAALLAPQLVPALPEAPSLPAPEAPAVVAEDVVERIPDSIDWSEHDDRVERRVEPARPPAPPVNAIRIHEPRPISEINGIRAPEPQPIPEINAVRIDTPRTIPEVTEPDSLPDEFWLDAVDCGMG